MSRKLLLVCIALVLAISCALGETSTTPAKLSAAQVIEKNVEARGGLKPWRAVQTLSLSGKMQAGGNEPSSRRLPGVKLSSAMPHRPAEQAELPFMLEMKRGRMQRLEIQFGGKTAVQVYDGAKGWKLRPYLNRNDVEPYSAEELKTASMQSDLDGPLVDYAAKGTKVEMEGMEKVEGKDNYKLKLTLKGGQVQHVWVDAKTFLETKIDGTPRRLDGKYHQVATYFRDYKPVNGLMMAHVLETAVEGVKQTEKIEIEKIVVNPKVEDSRFAKLQ
jgi:outer membrane lipoprotein-sorting protein